MRENIIKRAVSLLSVKSLVTLTAVFAHLAVQGQIAQDFRPSTRSSLPFTSAPRARRQRGTGKETVE